jgi:RNA polymerase sigma factor (sigma-70 family)
MGEPNPPPDIPNPLADLLRRAGAGDAAALEELLRRYEPQVRRAARALLRPPLRQVLDSFDLVQSVHRRLLPGLQQGKYEIATEDQLVGLAVTVLRHKVQRTAWRHRPRPGVAPKADTAAAEVDARDLGDRLTRGLDEPDRRLVELRLAGHETAEIAIELGCSAEVVRARLSRLRKRLRDAGADGG